MSHFLESPEMMFRFIDEQRNFWDNAPTESFFSTLKNELCGEAAFVTRAESREEIFEYIEVFYNRMRLHSTLGYLSPAEFEEARERIAS